MFLYTFKTYLSRYRSRFLCYPIQHSLYFTCSCVGARVNLPAACCVWLVTEQQHTFGKYGVSSCLLIPSLRKIKTLSEIIVYTVIPALFQATYFGYIRRKLSPPKLCYDTHSNNNKPSVIFQFHTEYLNN